jgi:hypothetical protein
MDYFGWYADFQAQVRESAQSCQEKNVYTTRHPVNRLDRNASRANLSPINFPRTALPKQPKQNPLMELIAQGIAKNLIALSEDDKTITYLHQNKRRNYANPEEQVQAETFLKLLLEYGYPIEQIAQFVTVPEYFNNPIDLTHQKHC